MIVMGIDPSINCTGVCICDTLTGSNIYHMIVGKATQKMLKFKHDNVYIKSYDKQTYTNDPYTIKERKKTANISDICESIKDLFIWYQPDIVYMEGISYGSTGSAALVDLAGLNYCIRKTLSDYNINYQIISPTSVKKFAVGNGGAEKDVMIASWKKLDKNIADITTIKLDDLADSYFIAHYQNDN
mgnify:CR=1 FL=1